MNKESVRSSSFGELLRRYRAEAGLTQELLAERSGLSARAISDLERGLHRAPFRETVHLLSDALGLESNARELFEAAARRPQNGTFGRSRPLTKADVVRMVRLSTNVWAMASGAVVVLAVLGLSFFSQHRPLHPSRGSALLPPAVLGARPSPLGERQADPAWAAIAIYAGSGQAGHVNGPRALAQFSAPQKVSVDVNYSDRLIFGDAGNNVIREVRPAGLVQDLCGSGLQGYADGPCASAQFSNPDTALAGPDGTVYVSDKGNLRVRAISPAGVVSTLAGSGVKGFADGPGSTAAFGYVGSMALDMRTGDLYLSDSTNNRIRRVSPAGLVTTVAGTGTPGYRDGAAGQAEFNNPHSLVLDRAGNVYIVDVGNHRIRMLTPDGAVSTLAGSGSTGFADGMGAQAQLGEGTTVITIQPDSGDLYMMDSSNHSIRKIAPDGTVSTVFQFTDPEQTPFAITVTPGGDFYLTDALHNRIYKVTGIDRRQP